MIGKEELIIARIKKLFYVYMHMKDKALHSWPTTLRIWGVLQGMFGRGYH